MVLSVSLDRYMQRSSLDLVHTGVQVDEDVDGGDDDFGGDEDDDDPFEVFACGKRRVSMHVQEVVFCASLLSCLENAN
jgi:hypothetical protein